MIFDFVELRASFSRNAFSQQYQTLRVYIYFYFYIHRHPYILGYIEKSGSVKQNVQALGMAGVQSRACD